MANPGLGSDHAVAGFLEFTVVYLTMPSSSCGGVNTNNHERCSMAPGTWGAPRSTLTLKEVPSRVPTGLPQPEDTCPPGRKASVLSGPGPAPYACSC